MKGNYYPKFNLILIDGKSLFEEAFQCFLNQVYNLQLYTTDCNNEITIKYTNDVKTLLHTCVKASINLNINLAKDYIKTYRIYSNIAVFFCLQDLKDTQEIFNYIDTKTIYSCINKIIKEYSKKILFYTHTTAEKVVFDENITLISKTTGKIQEILNIINFKFS